MKASEAFLAWIDGEAVQVMYAGEWCNVMSFEFHVRLFVLTTCGGMLACNGVGAQRYEYRVAPPTEGGGL